MPFSKLSAMFVVIVFSLSYQQSMASTDVHISRNFASHNVQLQGCDVNVSATSVASSSALWCAVQCINGASCMAFSFTENLCTLCDKRKITGFTQTSEGGDFHFARTAVRQELEFAEIYFPPNDVIGRMVVYDFTLFKANGGETNARLNFHSDSKKTIPFVVHCKLNYKRADINTCINNSWSSYGSSEALPTTVAVGRRSVMYVLITAEKFVVWLDGVFLKEYPHVLPVTDITYVTGDGSVWVHELSI